MNIRHYSDGAKIRKMAAEELKLKEKHNWKCKPGYAICVLDRGLVRFDYPSGWIAEPGEGAVHLHDRPPSVESCDLGVSIFRVSPEQAPGIPLDEMLLKSLDKEQQTREQSAIHHVTRPDLEIAWLEQRYVDPDYNRDARLRVALARGTVICLITMNYWASRASGLERVWEEVLRTLVMGIPIQDPSVGPVVH